MNRYTKVSHQDIALPDSTDIKDVGGIRINATGIIVAPLVLHPGAPWARVKELAGQLDLGGHKWRAPTVEEGFHIPDRSKFAPAVDPAFFPFLARGGWFWTSTVDASEPEDYAWYVALRYGLSNLSRLDNRGLVLAVRGPVALPGQY